MSLLYTIYIILIAAMTLRIVRDLIRLVSNIKWYKKLQSKGKQNVENHFIICIPAYKEQLIINETINHFASLDYPKEKYRIIIATTAKEKTTPGSLSTQEIAITKANEINQAHPGLVRVIHYPRINGVMAHQINFVANKLRDELNKPSAYFCIYNADSRPPLKTLEAVSTTIKERHEKGITPTVLQQSSLFFTPDKKATSWSYWVATGAAIHQSLWSLRHEISYYRKQSRKVLTLNRSSNLLSILRNSRIAHCVGHGLYVKGSYYLNNPLPEKLLNEDLPYGLLQCCRRQAIVPVPLLEASLSPAKLIELYRQKSVWFNPFFEFYSYTKSIINARSYESKFEVGLLTYQAYSSLTIWLIHTFVWIGSLVLSIILGFQYLLIWVALLSLYWLLPAYIYRQFALSEGLAKSIDHRGIWIGTGYVLSHSIGPLWSTLRWAHAAARGVRPNKPKTENI